MAGFVCEERLTFGPWPALERMLARLVGHHGMTDVELVGGSGDGGADIVASAAGTRWVIQSKYRASGGADGTGAREAVRAMTAYDAKVAVAATNTYFSPDASRYLEEARRNGIDLKLWNGSSLLNFFRGLPSRSRAYRPLREYQLEAVDRAESARQEGRSAALVVMATGLGKSLVASALIQAELERNPSQEVLLVAQTRDLVRQLELSLWPQLTKEHATHLWTDGEVPAFPGGVIVATWQSVDAALKRGEHFLGRFGLIVVDEAHHAPSSAYRQMLETLAPNFMVGLTATPWRGDERSLEPIFGEPVFTMDIVDGMQRGYLAEVDYRMLTDGIDWDEVAALSRQGCTVRDLNARLLMPDRDIAMAESFASVMRETPNAKGIGFCRTIEHATRLQPLLAAAGVRAAILHSQLPRDLRFRNLTGFRRGDIDCLLAVEMLNEGIDVPDVNVVAFMRVTHSRRIFVQQLGRGLRLSPGKRSVIVLDFVADIRRVAAGLALNRDAAQRSADREVFRFADGRIVQFKDDGARQFFAEYLADVADVENYDEGARLRFPPPQYASGSAAL